MGALHYPIPENQQQNAEDLIARAAREASIKRNPHPDFKSVESSRPVWPHEGPSWDCMQTISPSWQFGQGANDDGASLEKTHVEINPYEEGRPSVYNYKLMISGIIPRPIGFLSTLGKDGKCFICLRQSGIALPC